MNGEMERRLRSALTARADQITQDRLRFGLPPTAAEPAPKPILLRRWLPVPALVAVAVALALAWGFGSGDQVPDRPGPIPPAGPPASAPSGPAPSGPTQPSPTQPGPTRSESSLNPTPTVSTFRGDPEVPAGTQAVTSRPEAAPRG